MPVVENRWHWWEIKQIYRLTLGDRWFSTDWQWMRNDGQDCVLSVQNTDDNTSCLCSSVNKFDFDRRHYKLFEFLDSHRNSVGTFIFGWQRKPSLIGSLWCNKVNWTIMLIRAEISDLQNANLDGKQASRYDLHFGNKGPREMKILLTNFGWYWILKIGGSCHVTDVWFIIFELEWKLSRHLFLYAFYHPT